MVVHNRPVAKMPVIIKRHYDDKVLYEAPAAETLKDALEQAVADNARLVGANLDGANLDGVHLVNASLDSCSLVNANLVNASLDGCSLVSAILVSADLDGASLVNASLVNARLDNARLDSCNLVNANLINARLDNASLANARLPTGETWDEYITQVVPALLTAGGRELAAVATEQTWACHTWENCPIAEAFETHGLFDVPMLLRPRVEQFLQLFDARVIPLEAVLRTAAAS